jgi:hypothetical protein
VQVAFVYGKRPSSTLTRIFTGSTCYHVGFTDGRHFWDMNLLRRRRRWPAYPVERVILVEAPVPVSRDYLEEQLETDESSYSWLDYASFAVRWLAEKLRLSIGNAKGLICSEMVLQDLVANGWQPPAGFPEVPSPADLEQVLLGRRDAISRS